MSSLRILMDSNFPPIHALAVNVSTPGLWRAANFHLNPLRAGAEVVSTVPRGLRGKVVSEALSRPGEPSLFRDLPDLVLVAILQQLDTASLTSLAQTCRIGFSLACRRQFWPESEDQEGTPVCWLAPASAKTHSSTADTVPGTGDPVVSGLRNCFAEAAKLPPQVLTLLSSLCHG